MNFNMLYVSQWYLSRKKISCKIFFGKYTNKNKLWNWLQKSHQSDAKIYNWIIDRTNLNMVFKVSTPL